MRLLQAPGSSVLLRQAEQEADCVSGHTPWSEIRRKRWQHGRTLFEDLATAAEVSRNSLDKIGEGDWTPQDSAHLHLVCMVEKLLADPLALRTGRIVYGDAE